MLPLTCTGAPAEVYPGAAALMFAEPKLTPATFGCEAGAVWPAAMETVAGETVTRDVSLLFSEIVTPPVGAGDGRLTAKSVDCPNPTFVFGGRMIVPGFWTVTFAVVSGTFGTALA